MRDEDGKIFGLIEDELVAVIFILLVVLLCGGLWFQRTISQDGLVDGDLTGEVADIGDGDANTLSLDSGRRLETGVVELSGQGIPGNTVDIYDGNLKIGSTTVDANGDWSFSTRVDDPGDYSLIARSDDANGSSVDSAAFAFAVPAIAVGAGPADTTEATVDGSESSDNEAIVAEVAPTLITTELAAGSLPFGILNIVGSAEPNSQVNISVDNNAVGSAPVDDSGAWVFDFAVGDIPSGVHTVSAEGVSGGTGSDDLLVTFDAPQASLPAALNGLSQPTGTYTLRGTGTPGWKVAFQLNDDQPQIVPVSADGAWASEVDLSTAGDYSVSVYPVDAGDTLLPAAQLANFNIFDNTAVDTPPTEEVAETPTEAPAEEPTEAPVEEPTEEPTPEPVTTVVDIIRGTGQHNTLLAAVETAGLAEALAGEGPFTVFAPTDEAFAALPDGVVDSLLANPGELSIVLQQHVVAGNFGSETVLSSPSFTNLAGGQLAISTNETGAFVDRAQIVATDLPATNGVVHSISDVIWPIGQFQAPVIDDSGVPTFEGPTLTIVGTGEPGQRLIVELNGDLYGETTVAEDGTWLVTGEVGPAFYEIVAYTFSPDGLLRGISNQVDLDVK